MTIMSGIYNICKNWLRPYPSAVGEDDKPTPLPKYPKYNENYEILDKPSPDGALTLRHMKYGDVFTKVDADGKWDQVSFKLAKDKIAVRVPDKYNSNRYYIVTIGSNGRVLKLKEGIKGDKTKKSESRELPPFKLRLTSPQTGKAVVSFCNWRGSIISIRLKHKFFEKSGQAASTVSRSA